MAGWWSCSDASPCDAGEVINRVVAATVCDPDDPEEEDAAQAALLRDLFGPIRFRKPASADGWLTPTIVALATTIYEEQAFERTRELAAALEDAGCKDAGLLGHLRVKGRI